MQYMISSKENSNNHQIHVVHTDLGSFILFNDYFSASLEVLMEEKVKNSKFSNYVKKKKDAK